MQGVRRASLLSCLVALAGCGPAAQRSVEPEVVHVRIEQPAPAPAARTSTAEPTPRAPSRASKPSAVGVLVPPAASPSCDLELTLGLEGSVLAEHHDRNGHQDFHARFPAYPIDADTFEPVKAVADLTVAGHAILWFSPDGARVVVDHSFARDLEAVEAFALPAGASVPIGSLKPEGLELEPQRWVELMLRARVAATWAEGPAELCIEWRHPDGEAFDAYVTGERTLADSSTEPIHFLLRIDVDREISVVGLPR